MYQRNTIFHLHTFIATRIQRMCSLNSDPHSKIGIDAKINDNEVAEKKLKELEDAVKDHCGLSSN